ncbi:peptide chain release factor N(5)-glutamine methyltransferase [Fulvivirga sediminis]|uniref:Release factor glutamine methyltransferase n=1 Tax=Fulvivirga sediminis TaxID=2803949 RepID=A0A937JWS3_9BACT|nr:peptide chain release factor N(5)-glutamine methyltransferase [Fulvivirga sediminis]MBL3654818.1 peptide chain release factor N(5)-glutamine methyltransferase [Fulvivirga sediminis]
MPSHNPDSLKKLLSYIISEVKLEEPEEEISSIAHIILEHVFDINRTEIILDRSVNFSKTKEKQLHQILKRVNENEPIQYIIGESDFYGRSYTVGPDILIPRSETEELVQLVLNENKGNKIRFLDIGTGSGCIPITIAKELRGSRAYAIDFDPRVIKVARKNAEKHAASVEFLLIDILTEPIPVTCLDVIISNPPYVLESEKVQMKPNVLDYEPERALFVKDEDPLLFYRRIAELAKMALKEGGFLYFEINEKYGEEVKMLLEVMEYSQVEVIKDIYGKDRMVRATNNIAITSF